jgi:hypothetical protein
MHTVSEQRTGVGWVTTGARYGYLLVSWLFVLLVLLQVFLIGLSFFTTAGFEPHIEFGRTLSLVITVLIVLSLIGRLPRGTVGLTCFLLLLYALQYVFAEIGKRPELGVGWFFAFHPVNALVIFWVSLLLARRARRYVPAPLGTRASDKGTPPTRPEDTAHGRGDNH